MRTYMVLALGFGTLAALATTAGEAAAQRSARARVAVTVVASALSPVMQAEAVSQAVGDTLAHRRLLPSGAQIRVVTPAAPSPAVHSVPGAPERAASTSTAATPAPSPRRIVLIEFLAT